jgi:hypothetical protein
LEYEEVIYLLKFRTPKCELQGGRNGLFVQIQIGMGSNLWYSNLLISQQITKKGALHHAYHKV